MRQITQLTEMTDYYRSIDRLREKIALVPTMGALHRGHLSLVEEAARLAQRVVVSIFINPTQFAPHEDFNAYPRTLDEDLAKLADYPVDAVFTPTASQLYPHGYQTYVSNEGLGLGFCGIKRPTFFKGVCTVVLKLTNIVRPDFLIFGRKDFQQFKVVEQMIADLHVPTQVIGSPLVRDTDGLALSSRNVYLSSEQRRQALGISQGLFAAASLYQAGERRTQALLAAVKARIEQSPSPVIEYLAICQRDNLQEYSELVNSPAIILCAVQVGQVRLIDNIELG